MPLDADAAPRETAPRPGAQLVDRPGVEPGSLPCRGRMFPLTPPAHCAWSPRAGSNRPSSEWQSEVLPLNYGGVVFNGRQLPGCCGSLPTSGAPGSGAPRATQPWGCASTARVRFRVRAGAAHRDSAGGPHVRPMCLSACVHGMFQSIAGPDVFCPCASALLTQAARQKLQSKQKS